MHVEKQFDVARSRDEVVAALAEDETLVGLFPDSPTQLVEATPGRKTTRTHYRALGREGTATFHFTFPAGGNVRFEKVCDGKVWRELRGGLTVEERGEGARVRIEMDGRTRPFVPEFTIKGPMQEQIDQMARALRRRLERPAGA